MECSLCGEDIQNGTLRCEAESRLLDGGEELARFDFDLCEGCVGWIHEDLLQLEEPKTIIEIVEAEAAD